MRNPSREPFHPPTTGPLPPEHVWKRLWFKKSQEYKRREKAVPDVENSHGLIVGGILLAIPVFFLLINEIDVWAYPSRSAWQRPFLLLGLVLLLLPLLWTIRLLRHLWLLAHVRAAWSRRGVRSLVVHSNSPNCEDRIASEWLPRMGSRAVTLNWSERSQWRSSDLRVRVFRAFAGQEAFNPGVLVFRGLRAPLVFRFFGAFHQAK